MDEQKTEPDGKAPADSAEPDAPEDEARTAAEHEADRADDAVAAASYLDGDASSIISGLKAEIEGYENRLNRPGTDKDMAAMLKDRIKQCEASIAHEQERLAAAG